jgi:hypothetical protein
MSIIAKGIISCCGYTCAQGVARPWECPGCGTVHQPAPDPAPDGTDQA